MQVAFLGSAESWYYADLLRAAKVDEELVAISYRDLASRCGTWSATQAADGDLSPAAGLAARFSDGVRDLAACDAVLMRTMPAGSLEQVIFRMDVLGCYEQQGGIVLNPPRAVEAAVDKYLATCRLDLAGIPVPRTVVCQHVAEALQAFEQLGGDVVVKPLFGGEGRGLMRLVSPELAERAFKTLWQLDAVLYLQEFIDHDGFDIRVLLLGEEVFAMRRCNDHDWRTNVSRGARTEAMDLPGELLELARQAANVIQAPFAGVDLLLGPDGKPYVLEVNAVPGWKALAATLDVDIARCLWDYLASQVSQSPG
ncbi:MAG: RimK family alpha-L-glutamate ligase [Pirellulaceae bacterium]